tara:strand:+ start:1133 stop:1300 length:168 start_codon:yes stop_codon:yes gene_type:complete
MAENYEMPDGEGEYIEPERTWRVSTRGNREAFKEFYMDFTSLVARGHWNKAFELF